MGAANSMFIHFEFTINMALPSLQGAEVVARYDIMAAEVGVGGANWHIEPWHVEHVHAARAAFAKSFTWLDRFEAESDRQMPSGQV